MKSSLVAFALPVVAGCGIEVRDPFSAPAPQSFPPLLVRRYFHTQRAENCPAFSATGKMGPLPCEDVWMGRLER